MDDAPSRKAVASYTNYRRFCSSRIIAIKSGMPMSPTREVNWANTSAERLWSVTAKVTVGYSRTCNDLQLGVAGLQILMRINASTPGCT